MSTVNAVRHVRRFGDGLKSMCAATGPYERDLLISRSSKLSQFLQNGDVGRRSTMTCPGPGHARSTACHFPHLIHYF